MSQTAIPFVFMRGGSSRGPYLNLADLPQDRETLAKVLIAMVGSGHPLNIDGIGGGAAVTTKVAMLSPSAHKEADVDYFFAQVSVEDQLVDFKPSCGNILVGVGPAAIEMGLVAAQNGVTDVNIHAVNTGALVGCKVQVRDGQVLYDGHAQIDGVPGMAAPIDLNFKKIEGSLTSGLFPTGNRIDVIEGVEVSCVDAAMPMVIAKAQDMGITGYEAAAELDENRTFMDKLEAIRMIAGEKMGLGDVAQSVVPKFGVLAPPQKGGCASVRYFMPWKCHPTLAVTGSQCLGACLLAPGTVGEGFVDPGHSGTVHLALEHPMGVMDVSLVFEKSGVDFKLESAGLTRTARKLAEGHVFVPASIWEGH